MRTPITAYGTPSDRIKLDALAAASGKSSSAWVIAMIREQHARLFASPSPAPVEDPAQPELFDPRTLNTGAF